MAGFGHHVVHVFLHGFHFGEHSILDVHATAQQISGHRLQVKLALAHRHRADCTKRQAAKEAIVSTLGTAYSLGEQDPEEATSLAERLAQDPNWNKATALSLMLFVLLYSPCFVALVVIRQEAGSWGWVAFSMIFNTVFAYGVAAAAYRICMAL